MKINNAGKISAGIPLLMMPASLAFVFALSAILPELAPSDSSAVATGTALINLTVPDNISIDLSKTELEINISPSGSYANFAEDYTVAEVSTNNFTGYTLVLSDTDSDTNLVRTKVSTEEPDSTIATINTTNNPGYDSSVGIASGDLRSNAWGYSVGSGTAGSYTAGNYFDVPALASPRNIKVTSDAVSSDLTPVFFGTKVDNTMTPGSYQDEVIFTAIANYQPSSSNAITAISPSTISTDGGETLTIDTNIDYSENLVDSTHPLNVSLVKVSDTGTTLSCGSVALVNNSDKLRITCTTPTTGIEETNYTVQLVFTKLGDLTYNSEDTIAGEIPVPTCAETLGGIGGTGTWNGTAAKVLEDGNCWMTSDLATGITWYYAMGASSTSATSGGSSSTTTTFSVTGHCPSGWYMPTKAQFDTLISKYGSGGTLYTTLGLSSYRYFWSATQYDSSAAYDLSVYSSSAYVDYYSKADSLSYDAIRCVAP